MTVVAVFLTTSAHAGVPQRTLDPELRSGPATSRPTDHLSAVVRLGSPTAAFTRISSAQADGGAWSWIDRWRRRVHPRGPMASMQASTGSLGANEAPRLLGYGYTLNRQQVGFEGMFETAWDHLYLDLDGNGIRGDGTSSRFNDGSPGNGEEPGWPIRL